jgi:hypothetical protein
VSGAQAISTGVAPIPARRLPIHSLARVRCLAPLIAAATAHAQANRVLTVTSAVQAPVVVPRDTVRALPAPTGRYPVGTAVAYLADTSRTDAWFPRQRPIVLQVWYPAAARRGAPAPYLVERGLDSVLVADSYYSLDAATLRQKRAHERAHLSQKRNRRHSATLSDAGICVSRGDWI